MGQNYVITTVITPPVSTDLTSLINVKGDLVLNGATPQDDIYLKRLIKQASGAIVQFCNRQFAQATYQDLVRPQHMNRPAFIPNRKGYYIPARTPLTAVTSVTEDGTLLVVGTDYEVDLDSNAIYRLDENGYQTDWHGKPLIIVYTAGFTLPPVDNCTLPADVEDACLRMIKARWISRDRDPFLKSEDIAGIGREEYGMGAQGNGNITPDIEDLLENYRDIVLA